MGMGALFSADVIASMSGGIRPPAPKNYRLPDHFPSLSRAKRISLDLESFDPSIAAGTGPGWRRDAYIIGFGLSIGDLDGNIEFSEYYPCRHKDGPNLNPEPLMEWIGTEIAFYTNEIVGANLMYDADGYSYEKVVAPLAKWRDVQWAEALIDEGAFNYKLQRLGTKYCGHGKETDELEALYGPGYKKRMHEIHPGHMRAYGRGDVILPLQVLNAQTKELKRQHLTDVYNLECRLLPMLLYMRRRGQPVDMAKAERLHDTLTVKRAESLKQASAAVGKRGFEFNVENFGLPGVLKQALEATGLTDYPQTPKTKMPSITDKWLAAKGESGFQWCKHIADANQYDKALETFVNGYISDHAINGRIHCEFHPLRSINGDDKKNGTVAGRLSSSNPNLQNIPTRHPELGHLLREIFIPEAGYSYFSGDYSQIEYREIVHAALVRAQLPKEQATKLWGKKNGVEIWEKLQSAFITRDAYINDPTTDFHKFMAKLTGLERKYAKSVNFAIAFVMGLQSFAEGLGWLDANGKANQKAIDTLATYHTAVPFVKAVGTAMTHEAEEDGFTPSLLLRRAHYDLWEPRFYEKGQPRATALPLDKAKAAYGEKIKRSMTHAALNRYTQMGGADKMKTAMVLAWEGGLMDSEDLIISLTVHDELDGSVAPTPAGEEKLEELRHIMEEFVPLQLPTVTDFKKGANWAETH